MLYLTLFFARRVALQVWIENGSLKREIALYMRLQEQGVRVSFITYGGTKDLDYEKDLKGIKILCNKWNLPLRWYERLLPFLFPFHFLTTDVIKTNQTKGSKTALRTAKIWHKPLIARCGYMWSGFAEKNGNQSELALARKTEQDVFSQSSKVVVTTEEMKRFINKAYGICNEKIQVIPNYVITEVFLPNEKEKPAPNRILFVGRLAEQKNLFSLIEACAGLNVDLHFVGEGHLQIPLQEKAEELGVRLTMHGNLQHHQLPAIIRQSALFALVSTYEGHPKALVEAMSCGAAVLGTDVPGIREIIHHGENGWLCGTQPKQIREALQTILGDEALLKHMGARARQTIKDNFSLEHIVELEFNLLKELTQ